MGGEIQLTMLGGGLGHLCPIGRVRPIDLVNRQLPTGAPDGEGVSLALGASPLGQPFCHVVAQ